MNGGKGPGLEGGQGLGSLAGAEEEEQMVKHFLMEQTTMIQCHSSGMLYIQYVAEEFTC